MTDFYNAFAQPEIDLNGVHAGIGFFDSAKTNLTPERWPEVRQGMIKLGVPVDWLPESFQSPEELAQFVAHADRVNQQIKKAGGDYPRYLRRELPTKLGVGTVYDPMKEFQAAINDSFKLGIAPPASPDPADIQSWKVKISPWLEQEKLRAHKPSRNNGVDWFGTWEI